MPDLFAEDPVDPDEAVWLVSKDGMHLATDREDEWIEAAETLNVRDWA